MNKENEKTVDEDQADVQAEIRKLLDTPLSADDYRKAMADLDVDQAKLMIIRQKIVTQIDQLQLRLSQLDEQLGAGKMQAAVLFRRTLNAEAK